MFLGTVKMHVLYQGWATLFLEDHCPPEFFTDRCIYKNGTKFNIGSAGPVLPIPVLTVL